MRHRLSRLILTTGLSGVRHGYQEHEPTMTAGEPVPLHRPRFSVTLDSGPATSWGDLAARPTGETFASSSIPNAQGELIAI